jgi:hypothetical protein
MINDKGLSGLMNDTKWNEIRKAMYEFTRITKWRTKDIFTGYLSNWDSEWFYHFNLGEYKTIEYLEIQLENEEMKNEIVEILKKIHVPGEITNNSIFIYGYKEEGIANYI